MMAMLSILSACILLAATAYSMTSAAIITATDGFCVHEGAKYHPGAQVVLQDCQYKCKCVASEGYSFFMCEPLCEEYYDFTCADGQEAIMELEETSVNECKCVKYYCPKSLSVANFIDFGIDEDGFFVPEFYEEGETQYLE